jgi:hypothetical protein
LHLGCSIGGDHDALHAPLIALIADLWAAIPSYRGLYLTIVENDYPVSLAAFPSTEDGESITTSLRIPFAALGPGVDTESRVVFYAATPGAFVDLAADLGHALQTPTSTADQLPCLTRGSEENGQNEEGQRGPHADGLRPIALDVDLPPPTLVSGLSGVDELAEINRAVGILIDQGHHPDQAHAVLRRQAAGAGVQPHIYAARLLRS